MNYYDIEYYAALAGEVVMDGAFYVVIPCPTLVCPNIELEDGEILAVLKPLAKKEQR